MCSFLWLPGLIARVSEILIGLSWSNVCDRYTSVLESIKSIKKEKTVELKVLFNSLDYLRQNKDRAEKV